MTKRKKIKFIPLEKTDFQADGGLIPPSAQAVRRRSSLTGFILIKIALCLLFWLNFKPLVFPQERTSWEDKMISLIFKSFAKAFVAGVDIEKLKKENINKLLKMNEEKFRKRYLKVYASIKDLPVELKIRYSISEKMTREEVIKKIETLDKVQLYRIIDSIPPSIIANKFRQYLATTKQEIKKSNMLKQIINTWDKIIKKLLPSI